MHRPRPFRDLRAGSFRAGLLALAMMAMSQRAACADDADAQRRPAAGGQVASALEGTERLLAAQPADPSLRFRKGVLLTQAQRRAEAVEVFERLTEDYPDLPEPYNNLAVLYAGQGDYERARVALDGALRANPRYAVAQANLGDVHVQLARQSYQRAAELAPGDAALPAKLAALRGVSDLAPPPAAVKR